MKNFIQPGKVLTFTPTVDVRSGDVVNLGGALFGVAQSDVPAGENGEAAIQGVFGVRKASAFNTGLGQSAYWSDAGVTTSSEDAALIGVFADEVTAGEATAAVLLIPQASTTASSSAAGTDV